MIQDTSKQAYAENKATHPKCRQMVLKSFIDLGGQATLRQVQQNLNWEINRVSGRITELIKSDKIICIDKVKDPATGRSVNLYKINLQSSLF